MNCALIMAGGKGTRFWPVSTEEKPKQFLSLLGKKSMLQMTVDRINEYIDFDKIFICTSQKYVSLVKEQIPTIKEKNIIIEPFGMNTAPCIALSTMIINKYYPNSDIVVLPADHLVSKRKEFIDCIKKAFEHIEKNRDRLITFGIRPSRPETGYGYILTKECTDEINNVIKFVEKPNYEKALEYVLSGRYLWNSGMFVWNSIYILDLIKEYLPNTYNALKDIMLCNENEIQNIVNLNYDKTDSISIDYGIMEKTNSIFVIPCDFGWDDIGSWNSLDRYSEKDENGNVFKAKGITYNSSNNIILSRKPILVNGVEDIIVVETEDYIMISSKRNEQEIKKAKEKLDKLEELGVN